jgi:hypothetical protein
MTIKYLGDALVEKTCANAVEQAALCVALGSVCPTVYSVGRGSYIMERLEPLAEWAPPAAVLRRVRLLLAERVWNQPTTVGRTDTWVAYLDLFLAQHGHDKLLTLRRALYDGPHSGRGWCRVHGKPRLGNVAMRGDDIVLLSPQTPRYEIPSLPETDVGMLLLSLSGWENPKGGDAFLKSDIIDTAPDYYHQGTWEARCLFWGAVQCARVARQPASKSVLRWSQAYTGYWTEECARAAGI